MIDLSNGDIVDVQGYPDRNGVVRVLFSNERSVYSSILPAKDADIIRASLEMAIKEAGYVRQSS